MFCMKMQMRNFTWRQEAEKINYKHFFLSHLLCFYNCRSFSLLQSPRTASAMYLFCTCVGLWYVHMNMCSHVWGCAFMCLYVHTRLSSDFSLVCPLFYRDVISLWGGSLLIWPVQLPSLPLTPRDPVSWLPDFYVVIGDLSSDSRACMVSGLDPDHSPRPLCCFIYFELESVVSALFFL